MKFIAMLKDSLRETRDVKLFYVLLGLSGVVILFVGSVTYKALPMEPQIKGSLNQFGPDNLALHLYSYLSQDPETANVVAAPGIEDFQRTDDGPADKPWLGDYQFRFDLKLLLLRDSPGGWGQKQPAKPEEMDDPKARKQVNAAKQRLSATYLQSVCKKTFGFIDELEVKTIGSDDPNTISYQVNTKGTHIRGAKEWYYEPRLFFGLLPVPIPLMTLGDLIKFIGVWIIGAFGMAIIMFLSTIMTASFLPSMLGKGTVDLLIVKPIHRTTLFLYKFLGGLLFMFLNTSVIMGGIWLCLGIQTGLWTNALLLCIVVYTFQFAVFYSVSALSAVFTRSAIVAILGSVILWVGLFILGWTHWFFIEKDRDTKPTSMTQHWAYVGYDVVHMVLPHYKDIDWLTSKMIETDILTNVKPAGEERDKAIKDLDKQYGSYNWTSSLSVSCIFIALMLGLACWRFATKDY